MTGEKDGAWKWGISIISKWSGSHCIKIKTKKGRNWVGVFFLGLETVFGGAKLIPSGMDLPHCPLSRNHSKCYAQLHWAIKTFSAGSNALKRQKWRAASLQMIMVTTQWDRAAISEYFPSNIRVTLQRLRTYSWNIWIWNERWWLVQCLDRWPRRPGRGFATWDLGSKQSQTDDSGVSLMRWGRAMKVWGQVVGIYWGLNIWWRRRKRQENAEGREEARYRWGKRQNKKRKRDCPSWGLCFMAAATYGQS